MDYTSARSLIASSTSVSGTGLCYVLSFQRARVSLFRPTRLKLFSQKMTFLSFQILPGRQARPYCRRIAVNGTAWCAAEVGGTCGYGSSSEAAAWPLRL